MPDLDFQAPGPWPGKELPPRFNAFENPNSPPAGSPVQEQTKTVDEPAQKSARERVSIIQQFAELVRSVTPIAFAGVVLIMWYHSPQPAPVVAQAPPPTAPAPTPVATEELLKAFTAGYQAAQSNANTAAATDAPRKKPASANYQHRYGRNLDTEPFKQLNQQSLTPSQ